jgi:hypothetical protein
LAGSKPALYAASNPALRRTQGWGTLCIDCVEEFKDWATRQGWGTLCIDCVEEFKDWATRHPIHSLHRVDERYGLWLLKNSCFVETARI